MVGKEVAVSAEQKDRYLVEYQEALAFLRHDDTQAWTILGVSSTVAIGIWSFTITTMALRSFKGIMLISLGLLALIVGRLMARRLTQHTIVRRNRIRKLERELGFELISCGDYERQEASSWSLSINKTLDVLAGGAILGWIAYLVICAIGWSP